MPNVAIPTTIPSWFTVTTTPLASAASATGTRESTRVISTPNAPAIPPPATASATYSQGPGAPPERISSPDQSRPTAVSTNPVIASPSW